MVLAQDPTSSLETSATAIDQVSGLVEEGPKAMSDRTSGKLPLVPSFHWTMNESERTLLDEVLDQIKMLAISDDRNSIYDQIWEKDGIFDSPTT
jgi:hypothetical protein